MATEKDLDIRVGDYVDFGSYGRLYVVRKDAGLTREDLLWVTDIEDDRFNPYARGWFIKERYAERIIERGKEEDDEE